MADLESHNYQAAYSGLVNNLYVTLAVAAACVIGYELEVHIPRRRGKDGPFHRIPVRLAAFVMRRLRGRRRRGGRDDRGNDRACDEELVTEKPQGESDVGVARRQLGAREAWEFG